MLEVSNITCCGTLEPIIESHNISTDLPVKDYVIEIFDIKHKNETSNIELEYFSNLTHIPINHLSFSNVKPHTKQ